MKLLLIITFEILISVSGFAFAEDHSSVAIEHTNQAIKHGKLGHAPMLVEHAEAALKHVNMALKDAKGEEKMHLETAVKDLNASIEHGKMNHSSIATSSAEKAIESMTQSVQTNADAAEIAIESEDAVEKMELSTKSKGIDAVAGKGKAAAGEKAIEAPEAQKSESKVKWPIRQ